MLRYLLFIAFLAPALAQTAEDCSTLRKLGKRTEATACYRKLAASRSPGLRAEGLWGLRNFQDANDQCRAGVDAQPGNADLRVRWGRLFLERFDKGEAHKLFKEALGINQNHAGALLGLALIASEGFDKQAVEFAGIAALPAMDFRFTCPVVRVNMQLTGYLMLELTV